MLGDVAKFLRILGYDTLYFPDLNDRELIEMASREERVLVTSDEELYKLANRRGVNVMLIRGGASREEKVAFVFASLRIEPQFDPDKTRCSLCNGKLRRVPKEAVKGRVSENTYRAYDRFWVCEGCGRIYWIGSHWRNINRSLRRIRQIYMRLVEG